jgi:HEAT repeat protein
MPQQPFDCIKPGTQHLILNLCTTPTDEGSLAALQMLKAETNPFVLGACAWAVGQRGLREAVPVLRQLLEHGSFIVRVYAAEALWAINRDPDEVLSALLGVIAFRTSLQENRKAQLRATRVIEQIGNRPVAATEALGVFHNRRQAKGGVGFN